MFYTKIKNKEAYNGLLMCPLGYAKVPRHLSNAGVALKVLCGCN